MKKCNVCNKRFRLLAKNRYEVEKKPGGLNCLTQGTVYYNAFDCPHCGCQNIVGVIEKGNIEERGSEIIEITEPKFIVSQKQILKGVKDALVFNIKDESALDTIMQDVKDEIEAVLYDTCEEYKGK